jgi:hypothetical protein
MNFSKIMAGKFRLRTLLVPFNKPVSAGAEDGYSLPAGFTGLNLMSLATK